MATVRDYNFISFNSRQHALYFSQLLKDAGYDNQIISTPKGVSLGCGLSISFSPYITGSVIDVYLRHRVPIIGFYAVRNTGNYSQLHRIPVD